MALGVGVIAGAVTIPLAQHSVERPGIIGHGHWVLALAAIWSVLGGLATLAFLHAPKKAALVVILGLGVAVRLVAITPVAPLSNDLYRYAWDGRVQAHGIDPYRYAPHDPQLYFLHDPGWLWPLHTCPPDHHTGCSKINRQGVHTIYPPVAEAWFTALDVTGVTTLHDRGLEGAGLVVDLAILAVMLALLRRAGRDVRWVAVWALSPLPVLELVADAHVDGLALLLTLPALELARRRRPGWAGIVLGLAVLVKLYPLLLLPAIMTPELLTFERASIRRAARAVTGCVSVILLGYLPHVIVVGTAVIGYLPGYLKEEHYDSGTRYLLLADAGLHGKPATAAVGLLLLATVALVLLRRPPPMLGATWLYGALLLMTTPVQPWYGVGLAAVALLAARPEWMLVALAGYPIFVQTVLAAGNAVDVGRIAYTSAAVVVGVCALARWRRAAREGVSREPPSGGSETVGGPLTRLGMSFAMIPGLSARRLRRPATALVAVGVLALAGCSGSTGPKGPVGDQVTAVTEMTGHATSVSLDSGTLAAFSALEVNLEPLGAAKMTGTSISFPITSGYAEIHSYHAAKGGWIQGQIEHDTSGFSLTAGKTTLSLTNFVVDPGTSMLYGTVNGSTAKEPLLFLDGSKVKVTQGGGTVTLDGTSAKLTQTAATAFNGAFRTNQVKAGLPLGIVHLVAQATHVVTFPASSVKANLDLTGLSTSVKLDTTTAAALTSLGVNVSTIGTAKNSDGTLSFPITGGFVGVHNDLSFKPGFLLGSIDHEASGVVFSGHGKSLTLSDFVVDPGNSMLTARVPDKTTGGTIVPLLFLDGSKLKISKDSSGNTVLDGTVAKLTAQAAKALDGTFGTKAIKAGMPLGTVHLVASTTTS